MNSIVTPDVSWKVAGTDSALVKLNGQTICGFYIPSDFSGSTLKVKATYNPETPNTGVTVIDSSGADVLYTVAAGKFLRVDPADFAGIAAFQLVSGTSEAAGRLVRAAVREIA